MYNRITFAEFYYLFLGTKHEYRHHSFVPIYTRTLQFRFRRIRFRRTSDFVASDLVAKSRRRKKAASEKVEIQFVAWTDLSLETSILNNPLSMPYIDFIAIY